MENGKEKLGIKMVMFVKRKFKTYKQWIFGKLFEIFRRNRLIYREVTLSFDHPYFHTKDKGHLLFGPYAFEEHTILYAQKYLYKDLPLIELGACTGVVACVTDKMVSNKHIVVEANPYIIPVLEKNKKTNKCNFTIINKALAYEENIEYYVSKNPVDSGLYKKTSQKISIPGTTLQILAEDFKKINLLVDIEGAEIALIDHEIDLISEKVQVLVIEFHPLLSGEAEIKRIIEKLENYGLKCAERNENDAVFTNSR